MVNNIIKNLFFHMQKRFLQSSVTLSSNSALPTTGTSSSSSFTVEYLVNSCGLSFESAISVSKKFQLDEKKPQRAQSVIDLLKSYHFSDTQVAKLIAKLPSVLHCKVESVLLPKVDYLVKIGFAGELLPRLILSNPVILTRSLDSRIKPSLEFLKSILHSDEKMLFAIKRDSWLVSSDLKAIMQPNIDTLAKERVPAHVLTYLITCHPRVLMRNRNRMAYGMNTLKNLGFKPTSPMFVHALRVILQISESTWKEKIEVMKSLGWDKEEILLAFKRCPLVLAVSENKIKKALDFYTNTMKLDPHFVISDPRLLMFSIEKRITPRFNVVKVLESKKLIPSFIQQTARVLAMPEERFMRNYVLKYMTEVPVLLEMYPGAEKFLKGFIEKFKGNVPAVLEMYPGAEKLLNKYFEK